MLLAGDETLHVTGIEIQEVAARCAMENAALNSLSGFSVLHGDLREYRTLLPANGFDAVLSNPPYYPVESGAIADDAPLAIARSELCCTLSCLCACAAWCLRFGGSFFLVHKPERLTDLLVTLRENRLDAFKTRYRNTDILLIDDIQFFANKERSQEEFFHTFNALLEGNQQIILTSDRYPKEINGVEDRLKSRFGWGLTVAIEPPELETRVAILMKKADENDIRLPGEVAFFIAKRLRSNVRELEGALNRVIANANFTGRAITIDFVREALRDLLALQEKLVTIDNIQKTVAEYYKIKVADLLSKRRSRSVARPRQMAMALAKELTNHSLPEIGDAFGGRDHTTVLHACRKIEQLREESHDIKEDFSNLIRTLSS